MLEIIISFIATFKSVLVAEMVAVIIISDVVGVPGCARMFLLVHDLDGDLCIPPGENPRAYISMRNAFPKAAMATADPPRAALSSIRCH